MKYFYKQQYTEALDLIEIVLKIISLSQGAKFTVHQKMMKACKLDDIAAYHDVVCKFNKDDFDREWSHTQFKH